MYTETEEEENEEGTNPSELRAVVAPFRDGTLLLILVDASLACLWLNSVFVPASQVERGQHHPDVAVGT